MSKKKLPLFFDGAFGTYYLSRTSDEAPCEFANLNHPECVRAIHKEYIAAGCDAIKTNTFGANYLLCDDTHMIDQIIQAGYEIACDTVRGTDIQVFADIGYIRTDNDDVEQEYLRIVRKFISLGAENFLFETLGEYTPIIKAIAEIKRRLPEAFVIVSFAVSQDGYSKRGYYYKDLLAQSAENKDIDAIGLNCVCGPSHLCNLMKQVAATIKILSAMPNAGYPSSINGRVVFENNAQYFAGKLVEMYACGVDIVGGCCGTTPEHLRLAIQQIKQSGLRQSPAAGAALKSGGQPLAAVPAAKTAGAGGPASLRKLIAVELDPPADYDCDWLLQAAEQLKFYDADMITLADSPLSRVRADSIMTAARVKREIGIDVLPHLSCRDKNHIAIKAGLLGAAFEGINKVLVVTGDPLMQVDQRKTAGVFTFNSFDLIAYINSMNSQVFVDSPFTIGGALNINAKNFSSELARAKKKIDRGASILLTQPIFSRQAVDNYLLAKETLSCSILAGILPVAGYKNALFLINEVSGIEIPSHILDQLKEKSPEETRKISLEFSMGFIDQVYEKADGFYIMTPLKKVEIVTSIINVLRRREQ